MTPKAQTGKEKIDKLDFAEIKNFCASKDTTKKVKRQLTEWETLFANHIPDKRFESRTHQEFLQLNPKKTTSEKKKKKKKWAKFVNRHFSKEDIQRANQQMEKMLNIISHQRNANQNTMRWALGEVQIKRQIIARVIKNVEKQEPSHTAGM